MSIESEWKGKIQDRVEMHSEYHTLHFKEIGNMKLELTKLQVKVGLFSFFGSIAGGAIVSILIVILTKKL